MGLGDDHRTDRGRCRARDRPGRTRAARGRSDRAARDLLRLRPVAISSVALFLCTAALFAITVFVPLYLQTTTDATPTEAGLLLVPMMIGITVSTNLAGIAMSKTGRYKRYPVIGLGLMTAALVLIAAVVSHPSRSTIVIGLVVFGLGSGWSARC